MVRLKCSDSSFPSCIPLSIQELRYHCLTGMTPTEHLTKSSVWTLGVQSARYLLWSSYNLKPETWTPSLHKFQNQSAGTTSQEQRQRINGATLIGNLTQKLHFPLQEVNCRNTCKLILAAVKTLSTAPFLCYSYFSHTCIHLSLGLTSRHSASWNLSLIVRKIFLWLVIIVFTAANISVVGLLLLFFNLFWYMMFLSIDSDDFATTICFQTCESKSPCTCL